MDLVGDKDQVVTFTEVRQAQQFVAIVDPTNWIVWIAQNKDPSRGLNLRLHRFKVERPAIIF